MEKKETAQSIKIKKTLPCRIPSLQIKLQKHPKQIRDAINPIPIFRDCTVW